MKHLKRFNESVYLQLPNIRNTCKDILLELSDRGIRYEIYGYEDVHKEDSTRDIIRVEIGDENISVKLKEFELELQHLLSYLKEEGFELSNNSYFQNDTWDYYESCPECGSESVSSPDDLKSMRGWYCNKCKHIGHQDDFQRPEHPIKEGDLIWAINQNYYVNFMSLDFIKIK
jgi:hypothetical protein